MSKMSVNDAAEHFGISKEAIHNRIRRGSLEVVLEDGVKMVVVDASKTPRVLTPKSVAAKTNVSDDRYYKFLEEQNVKLQSRVETLESETRTLRDQKELMLVEERQKIEAIYKEKDEQLKNILSTISSKFLLGSQVTQDIEVETLEAVDADVEEEKLKESKIISLKKYIKKLNISEKKAHKIFKRFEKRASIDERIIIVNEKIYLDILRYDYGDLIKK